jgi:uncharacterized protein with PIN domain
MIVSEFWANSPDSPSYRELESSPVSGSQFTGTVMDTPSASADEIYQHRFFADVMLGTLARWLRILGYDTRYERSIDDEELIQLCLLDGRVALTRDRRLAKRKVLKHCLLIQGNTLGEQLTEVLEFTKGTVSPPLILSRCLECNAPIVGIEKEAVVAEVPPYVFRTQDRFSRCPDCGRIFWAGTHRERILERLEVLIGISRSAAELP